MSAIALRRDARGVVEITLDRPAITTLEFTFALAGGTAEPGEDFYWNLTPPRGWISQDHGESEHTPQLLAEAGFDYVLDWPNDDQPYPMKVGKKFVSMPNQPEWDDVQQLWLRRINTARYPDIVGDAFELLHHEGGQVFNLSIHPWLMGMAHRIKYLDEALRRIERFGNIWQATPGEVARHYRETMMG